MINSNGTRLAAAAAAWSVAAACVAGFPLWGFLDFWRIEAIVKPSSAGTPSHLIRASHKLPVFMNNLEAKQP